MGMNCQFFDEMENVSMYMDSKYYICQLFNIFENCEFHELKISASALTQPQTGYVPWMLV